MKLSKDAQEVLKPLIKSVEDEIIQYQGQSDWIEQYKITKEILDFLKTGLE